MTDTFDHISRPAVDHSAVQARATPQGGSGPDRPRLDHIPALDGLRGAAVVAVMAFHDGRLTGGYLGVDLFFVLSGYLITSLLLAEVDATGDISLGRFWSRRARRLLPALLLLVAVVAAAAHWSVDPTARGWLRGEALATLGYVANIHTIVAGGGYWQQAAGPTMLQHTWSLAIEEQFYLVWPLVVLAVLVGWGRRRARPAEAGADVSGVRRRRVRQLFALALVGAVASGGLMVALSLAGADRERLYLGTDTRIAAVLLGAVAATVQRLWLDRLVGGTGRRLLRLAAVPAVLLLAYAWARIPGGKPELYRGGLFAISLAAALIVLHLATDRGSVLARPLSRGPLPWLGLISYGLYLWHWPIYQWIRPGRVDLSRGAMTVLRVALSLIAALLSYHLLEHPIRRGAIRPQLARLATPAAACVATVAVLLGTTGALSPAAQSAAAGYTKGSGAWPKILVVGDSVGDILSIDGLRPLSSSLKVRTVDGALVGCNLFATNPKPSPKGWDCTPGWPAKVDTYRPDIVVVLFGALKGAKATTIDGEDVWPCEPAYKAAMDRRLDQLTDVLAHDGATVVLVTAPGAANDLFRGDDPDRFDREHDCHNRLLVEAAERDPRVAVVDLAAWVCPGPDHWCRDETAEGQKLRPDGLHFRAEGAEDVARWLIPQVLRATP